MGKIAQNYLEINPWKIIEKGFHVDRALVSESLFSLSNEYMGVRGFFDEGYPHEKLIGTYFNGIYEIPKDIRRSHYKGISDKLHYMVNSANFFYTRIYINDELHLFNHDEINHFERSLDFKTGEYIRSYQVKNLFKISFKRLLNMKTYQIAHQMITIEPIDYFGEVAIEIGIDFDTLHWNNPGYWNVANSGPRYSCGKTTTNQSVFVSYDLSTSRTYQSKTSMNQKLNLEKISFQLSEPMTMTKTICSIIDKSNTQSVNDLMNQSKSLLAIASYQKTIEDNRLFYQDYWMKNDIEINGDPINQQGIRYCLFQLVGTYQGVSEHNNIGAKGLTGEAYSGHAFWDSETYCLPVYLFTNPKAAKNLLMFRYNTLEHARKRARELDCLGACYPIATLNGDEACDLWQHASLQFQPTSAVAYAIWHYVKNTKDEDFLLNYGFEMLVEIARFFSSRGQFNQDKTKFGYYGVMGPDEFQMMVNHNTYTNYMAKASMKYMIDTFNTFKDHSKIKEVVKKLQLSETEIANLNLQCELMYIPYQEKTKLYEQHEGFFDLPHINIHDIPVTDFPLYAHWSYDRIYRNDMIKQPDVLMLMFLYNSSFDIETKKANYDFYEPKTIHESSLSPSIHSIFASEIGYKKQAMDFFGFATRMDLDDYNRNTKEGLHLTSIAAAWVNIVYGFGGLRSDGDILKIAPYCPEQWDSYQFNIHYFESNLKIIVNKTHVEIINDKDLSEPIMIYQHTYQLKKGNHQFNVAN
ncbi:MAG: glycosyl hydrolase family 65 protein [Acholeplasmataceae bacterium]|jgi:maltose phosphorylase|nr:glycosyl hydrolase family 65 protein [Acholeplasmataceae bacterium]